MTANIVPSAEKPYPIHILGMGGSGKHSYIYKSIYKSRCLLPSTSFHAQKIIDATHSAIGLGAADDFQRSVDIHARHHGNEEH